MAAIDPANEEEWRFMFDLHGVLSVSGALSAEQTARLNKILDDHVSTDTDGQWRTLRFPVASKKARDKSLGFDEPDVESLLDWGKEYRDVLDAPKITPILNAILGERFRLDHIYLDVIKPPALGEPFQQGPINSGLHGSSGGFDPAQYYRCENGQMFNGLSVVAFNLNPVGPEDGGFACVPGTHKSNYRYPNSWRNMADGIHPTVTRVGGPAGSAIIFTEALTHGTLPWIGAGERRTLFVKYSPHPLSWASTYFDAQSRPWSAELSDKQRIILDAPSVPGGLFAQPALQRLREAHAAKL